MPLFPLNRDLLNVKFEGYKLSSNEIVRIHSKHAERVGVAKLQDDEFSYQYIRAYALHNHLHWNPSDPSSVYWCNEKLAVLKATLHGESISTECVFSFSKRVVPKANFSLCFLSEDIGIACSGNNEAILFRRELAAADTEEHLASEKWSLLASVVVGDLGHPVLIATAAISESGDSVEVLCAELLIGAVESPTTQEPGKPLITYHWIRIHLEEENDTKSKTNTMCTLNSKSHALYSIFQWDETSKKFQLLFMSETEPFTTSSSSQQPKSNNSLKPVISGSTREEAELSHEEEEAAADRHYGLGYKQDEKEGSVYTWDQSEEDVVITFKLPDDVTKKDLCVRIDPPEVVVGLTDGSSLLRGELAHSVDNDGCTWTLDGNT